MTARRPPRISDYSNEIQLRDSDSASENDARTRSTLSSPLTGSPTKLLSLHPSTGVHPLLTDFGPCSATLYFRQALERLKSDPLNKEKGKEHAPSSSCDKPRRGMQRTTRKMQRTVFDDDSGEEDEEADNDVIATGDDANMFATSYGVNRLRTDAWSEDEDIDPSTSRMRGRHTLDPATSRLNVYGDPFNQPKNRTTSMLSSQFPALAPPQLTDPHPYPPLGSAQCQTQGSTMSSDVAQLSNTSTVSRSVEIHEILPSIEDPSINDVPETRNAGCDCKILCFCGTSESREEISLQPSPRPLKRLTRSNPVNSRLGKSRGSPSNPKQLEIPLAISPATASDPTEATETSRRQRPNRSQDFEEHANEKRKSWRAGGEWRAARGTDLSDDGSDLSEVGSMSCLSAPAGGRPRRLPSRSQSRSAGLTNLILLRNKTSRQATTNQSQNMNASTRQSIAQALDGINDQLSAGVLDNASTRSPAQRPVSSRFQEETRSEAHSDYRNEENLLGRNLLFEQSDDEDEQSHSLQRRSRLSESLWRSPHRRRALRGFQHATTTIGLENAPVNSHTQRRVSLSANWVNVAQRPSFMASPTSTRFDYADLTPQQLPKDVFSRRSDARSHAGRRQKATPRSSQRTVTQPDNASSRSNRTNDARAAMAIFMNNLPLHDRGPKYLRRTWDLPPLRTSHNDAPACPLGQGGHGWPNNLPVDIFILITQHLSHQDVCNLRLVNSTFESILVPVIFRSVVTKFDKSMFDVNLGKWEKKPPEGSIFEKYGMEIHKFGIAFEADLEGLQTAAAKVIQNTQSSWWGKYTWPVPKYPRFESLATLENLADHLPLLRGAFKDLINVSELALCVDSGHGWLNGPDMSDLAVWDLRCSKGPKVFGKTFQTAYKWYQYGRNELFKWAQLNSINEALKSLKYGSHMEQWGPESQFLRSVAIRDFESYAPQNDQTDVDPDRHIGGTVPTTNPNTFNAQHQHMFQQAGVPNWAWPVPPVALNHMNLAANPVNAHLMTRAMHRGSLGRHSVRNRVKNGEVTQPQWPIIYNGHNVTAEIGGHCTFVQNKIADPRAFPLQPGHLTEAQAQWLMETVWAQRAFLSAYTTAILTNKTNFKQVHSVHIAKISSGLLPSLEQRELWQALPNLRTLKILVSPDWRIEYMPGDQSFQTNMLISPVQASIKFAEFLQRYVSRIEHLSTLTIGFVGGGEHATGLLARNQHVLPAPVTFDPRSWLTDHVHKPNLNTMIAFNHIKNLSIENAWLSPFMLEGFMTKSKDTSLRQLTLDSVSLTSVNSQRTNAPMTTLEDGLKPEYAPAAWVQERLPSEHCWPAVIDRLTPGVTFSQLKYNTGLVDPIQVPPPEATFRGNVEKLTFKSCGYVKISGIPQSEFNQNGLVMPNTIPRDHGLTARENLLREARGLGEMYGNATASVMMREKDLQGHEWFGLGRLTQCIHPVEKRVLEEAWQMRFGWQDDIERFGAVEDGCFEGGTGRFSGEVTK